MAAVAKRWALIGCVERAAGDDVHLAECRTESEAEGLKVKCQEYDATYPQPGSPPPLSKGPYGKLPDGVESSMRSWQQKRSEKVREWIQKHPCATRQQLKDLESLPFLGYRIVEME